MGYGMFLEVYYGYFCLGDFFCPYAHDIIDEFPLMVPQLQPPPCWYMLSRYNLDTLRRVLTCSL